MTLHKREQDSLLQTYRRLPIDVAYGKGMYLYDRNGRAYLDFLNGVAVNALGYGNEKLVRAISDQTAAYIHVSNYFVQQPQVELAEKLIQLTGFKRVFFCNSGTEASEAALKLARKWGSVKGKSNIVSLQNSFHGRTMGSLSMMSNDDYRDGFGPFLDGFQSIPFNDVPALRSEVSETTAAVIFECIQGEGGIYEISNEFASALKELKRELDVLLIADEVQSGVGRTGKFLACEHYGLTPDIVTLAKPLGGGLPLGAMLASEALQDVLKPGNHGTTFGGNPVACAAGKVVLEEVVDNGLMRNAEVVGGYFLEKLASIKHDLPDTIKEVRGRGLMIGAELTFPGKTVVDTMLEKGIIINCTHGNVLRFLPPLIAERSHVDELVDALRAVLESSNVPAEVSH